jgi:hypothetical protein
MKYLLILNKKKCNIPQTEENAKILQGIRENYYTHTEIKEWIQHGKIRAFSR